MNVSEELAAAIRAVNLGYNALSPTEQDRIEMGFDDLEAEVNAAILAEDRSRALVAIRVWRGHWLRVFKDSEGARPDPRTAVR
jgi:hypothetical protein